MNKKIIPYIVVYVLLLVACVLLMEYPKAELHLMLNSCHSGVGDVFFKYYTQLAEWPLYVIALIPLCFRRWRWTVWYAVSEGVAALVIRLLKIAFHSPRPVAYFDSWFTVHGSRCGFDRLPLVEGVKMHHSNSFPSGHASTFFLFFTFAALLLCQYYAKEEDTLLRQAQHKIKPVLRSTAVQQASLMVLLLMAAVGGYSRIYLSQHFLSDVTVGSMVGVIVPCLMFFFFSKKIMK